MTTTQHAKLNFAVTVLPPLIGISVGLFTPLNAYDLLAPTLVAWVLVIIVVNMLFVPRCPQCAKRMRVKVRPDYRIDCGFSRTYYRCKHCNHTEDAARRKSE